MVDKRSFRPVLSWHRVNFSTPESASPVRSNIYGPETRFLYLTLVRYE